MKIEIKEIVLSNGKILKINYSILRNKELKCETVYKTANMTRLFEVSKELYSMSDKFTVIGEKLEVIVNLNDMIENMSSLSEFLYVEVQFNNVDLNKIVPYSIKKPGFTVSMRYIHEDSYLIEMKVREKTDLDNVVRPTTAEITIYNYSEKNVQRWKDYVEWFKAEYISKD